MRVSKISRKPKMPAFARKCLTAFLIKQQSLFQVIAKSDPLFNRRYHHHAHYSQHPNTNYN